ncbi:MAG: Fic family protein [Polaribacter sp.]
MKNNISNYTFKQLHTSTITRLNNINNLLTITQLFKKYKALNYTFSLEEEEVLMNEYVYYTNKLEGNKLSLLQTVSLLKNDVVSGENISLKDILEHKGMYKAINLVFQAVRNKEILSVALLKELNGLAIGSYFKAESAYLSAKNKGQEIGEFKTSENIIKITKPKQATQYIEPLSTIENTESNMKLLINKINLSNKSVFEKAVFLAQELWLHQPFIDGNKRTGRLLINFLTMREGYPLFVYSNKATNYNDLLVTQYLEKKPNLVKNYIEEQIESKMSNVIEIVKAAKKNKNKGFRMML